MRKVFAALLPLILLACTSAQVLETTTKADDVIAKAQEEIAMACWAAQTADVAFMTFMAPKADPAIVADVRKAMDVVNTICANPPTNAQEAIATILAAYKKATTATAVTGV
jgi:hypothetical protein